MLLTIPAFDNKNIASITLALMFAFAFIGLSPIAVMDDSNKALDEMGGSSLLRQVVYLVFFAVSFVCYKSRINPNDFKKCLSLWLLLGWCLLSVFWADHPSISLRRVSLLFITTATVFMLINTLSFDQVISSISKVLAGMIVVSVISVFFISGAVHTGAELLDSELVGNWKGIFIHKNHAGPALVFAIALFLFNFQRTKRYGWLVMVILSLIFLFFTKSKTSMALLVPCLAFGFCMYKLTLHEGLKRAVTVMFFVCLTAFIVLIPTLLEFFIALFDNPEAFTGRATIWNMVYLLIQDHFWFGIGFGSVWSVGEDMRLVDYATGWVDWVFTLTHAHNGYLEIFAATGFVGFLLCIVALVITPFLKGISNAFYDSRFIFLYFTTFLFFVLHNLLEADYLNAADGRWLIILIMHFCLYLKNERSML
ncbi:O-antigen ligase family protein [Rheinheimera muenzenbergensis]|uniref:O-antigen ligase family protein n=1 Tax=Rheinheimera muenzenbergensis TaxID=1193628 RepID=A0ABU8C9W4_9GAMM